MIADIKLICSQNYHIFKHDYLMALLFDFYEKKCYPERIQVIDDLLLTWHNSNIMLLINKSPYYAVVNQLGKRIDYVDIRRDDIHQMITDAIRI